MAGVCLQPRCPGSSRGESICIRLGVHLRPSSFHSLPRQRLAPGAKKDGKKKQNKKSTRLRPSVFPDPGPALLFLGAGEPFLSHGQLGRTSRAATRQVGLLSWSRWLVMIARVTENRPVKSQGLSSLETNAEKLTLNHLRSSPLQLKLGPSPPYSPPSWQLSCLFRGVALVPQKFESIHPCRFLVWQHKITQPIHLILRCEASCWPLISHRWPVGGDAAPLPSPPNTDVCSSHHRERLKTHLCQTLNSG